MPHLSSVVSVSRFASPLPLLKSEVIIFRARPHLIISLSFIGLLWAVGGLFLRLLLKFEIINAVTFISTQILEIIYISAFAFVGLIIFLYWLNTEYILTNKRVEWRSGIISEGTISIALEKIQNIVLKISIVGRIFNFGDIKIEPAGIAAYVKFGGIKNPKLRKGQIEEAIG